MIEFQIAKFYEIHSKNVSEEDQYEFNMIYSSLKQCLSINPFERPDFIELCKEFNKKSMPKEKLKYLIAINEKTIEELQKIKWQNSYIISKEYIFDLFVISLIFFFRNKELDDSKAYEDKIQKLEAELNNKNADIANFHEEIEKFTQRINFLLEENFNLKETKPSTEIEFLKYFERSNDFFFNLFIILN